MSESPSIHHGIKWVTVSMVTAQAVRLLSTIALARLLTPEIFGLVAMANVAITLVAVIREVGVGSALIQREDASPEAAEVAASTTFWLSMMVSAVIFVAAYAASPWIASFFDAVGLVDVLRILFVGFLIDGMIATPDAVLRKNLEFGRHALIEIVESFAAAILSIALAVLGYGVWSLVAGQLVARVVQLAMVFRAARWRPKWIFDVETAKELVAYGKYLWAFSIVSAIGRAADQLLIGRLLGAASLGIYSVGVNLCKLPANRINSVVLRISFPVLSRMQTDLASLGATFLRTLRHVSLVAFPMGFGLFSVAESFVLTIYGPKWEAMVPVIQILPFYAVSLSVSATSGPVFQAIAKPQVLLYTSLVHQAVLITLLFLLAPYGLAGISLAALIPSFVSSIIAFTLAHGYLDLRARDILNPLLRAGASSLLMVVVVKALQLQLDGMGAEMWVQLAASVVVGALAYLGGAVLFNREDLLEFATSVRQVVVARGSVI